MIIRTDSDRSKCIDKINAIPLVKKDGKEVPWSIDCSPWKPKRSVAMNSLYYAWLAEIAKYKKWGIAYTRGYIKWEFGVPILLARGEPEFDALIDSIVNNIQYEGIIKLFGTESIQISSAMKVPEMLDYLTNIEQFCFSEHIPLSMDDDRYNEAMRK